MSHTATASPHHRITTPNIYQHTPQQSCCSHPSHLAVHSEHMHIVHIDKSRTSNGNCIEVHSLIKKLNNCGERLAK